MTSGPEIKVLRTVNELEALAPEWSTLSARFGTPLLDHDWLACAARTLHREEDLRVITARADGVLTAVAPMAVDASRRHLTLLGSSVLHEPGSWLYSSDDALRQLADAVVSTGHVFVMDRLPSESAMCRLMPRLLRWQAITIRRPTAKSFYVRTDLPWETYCATLSERTRRRLAAAHARAERTFGQVRFARLDLQTEEVDDALDLLVDVEAAGWKARNGSALANRPELFGFFHSYSHRAAALRRLRLSVLRFGDAAAAVELGVEAYGRMWGLKLGYDERFAAFAPALQLVHASIEAAHRIGLEGYEFLGAAESWQERWRPSTQKHQLAAVYPFRPSAFATALRDAAAHFTKRAQRPLRTEAATGATASFQPSRQTRS